MMLVVASCVEDGDAGFGGDNCDNEDSADDNDGVGGVDAAAGNFDDINDFDASGEVERGGVGGELDRGQEVSEQVWKQVSDQSWVQLKSR